MWSQSLVETRKSALLLEWHGMELNNSSWRYEGMGGKREKPNQGSGQRRGTSSGPSQAQYGRNRSRQ